MCWQVGLCFCYGLNWPLGCRRKPGSADLSQEPSRLSWTPAPGADLGVIYVHISFQTLNESFLRGLPAVRSPCRDEQQAQRASVTSSVEDGESVHLLWVTYLINQHTISGFAKGPLVTYVLLYILITPSNSGARLVFLNPLILHPKDNFYS